MCKKAVGSYSHALEFARLLEGSKKYNKAINTYHSTMQFVPECYRIQEMCDKAVNTCFLYLILFPIDIKLKKYLTELFLKILIC